MNKLSRKDIAMLEALAVTEESKGKLAEYIQQREKAAKAYKAFREAVVNGVEVEKIVKPVKTKRKFKAGDKVRVTNVAEEVANADGLKVGDITKVIAYKSDLPRDFPTKSNRQVITKGISYFEESALELVEEKSPNELRAEVIRRAKEFVEENKHATVKIGHRCHSVSFDFVVNPEKRRVTALSGGLVDIRVQLESVAKCNPDDVFNEHICKAIALGRALRKDVSEFENAVQPTEPVVGHVVKGNEVLGPYRQDCKFTLTSKKDCDSFYYAENYRCDFIYSTQIGAIIDDTNAIYEEGIE